MAGGDKQRPFTDRLQSRGYAADYRSELARSRRSCISCIERSSLILPRIYGASVGTYTKVFLCKGGEGCLGHPTHPRRLSSNCPWLRIRAIWIPGRAASRSQIVLRVTALLACVRV